MDAERALVILDGIFDELLATEVVDAEMLTAFNDAEDALAKHLRNSEPIIYAKWEWREFYGEPGLMLCCSNCRETSGANKNFPRCPHCGAYMSYEMFGVEREE
jgi:hypothetical protein